MRSATRVSTSVSGWDEVGDVLNRSYGNFRFRSSRTQPSFSQRGLADDQLILARADLQSSVRSATATYDAPTVLTILTGFVTLRSSGGAITSPKSGGFLIGGDAHSYLFDGELPRSLVVQLSRTDLEGAARHLTGTDLDLPHHLPALPSLGAPRWWRAVAEVKRIYESEELYRSYLIKRTAQRRLHEVALQTFGLVHPREDQVPSERVVAVAKRYIDEHLDTPLTVSTVAGASHVSVRTLQAAFERTGGSPLAYIKRARLEAVKHDLTLADPGTDTVRDIGLRWGFTNLGRLAADYHQAFAVQPRRTLAA